MTWCNVKRRDIGTPVIVAGKQDVADRIVKLVRCGFGGAHDVEAPSSDPGRIDIELRDGTRITLRVESIW